MCQIAYIQTMKYLIWVKFNFFKSEAFNRNVCKMQILKNENIQSRLNKYCDLCILKNVYKCIMICAKLQIFKN